jgi:putative transposase
MASWNFPRDGFPKVEEFQVLPRLSLELDRRLRGGGVRDCLKIDRRAHPVRAERPDHVWAIDFQWDQTAAAHSLKLLHVVDEFTREALAIECDRRIDADKTVDVINRLVGKRGTAPGFLRCDRQCDPGLVSLQSRRERQHRAGSAWQNAYVESFNSRVRDELLAVELFSCLTEARVLRGLARRLQPAPAP